MPTGTGGRGCLNRVGSFVWKREGDRWARVHSLDRGLRNVPGHADVWADQDDVCAVLVGNAQLTMACLTYDDVQTTYSLDGSPVVWPINNPQATSHWHSQLSGATVECATITRDNDGIWWVAYDQDDHIWIRKSRDVRALHWEEPFAISESSGDDLSVIFNVPGGIGVLWTDQAQDALFFRRHSQGKSFQEWDEIETVAQGNKTANDHLNAAVASDGTVYVASKTKRYVPGEPQLSLRVRHPDGNWQSVPYANLDPGFTPTRPIALLPSDKAQLWLVHTLLDRSVWNSHQIVYLSFDLQNLTPKVPQTVAIGQHLDMRNATPSKGRLPFDAPWIVLASDRLGNVYEGTLK